MSNNGLHGRLVLEHLRRLHHRSTWQTPLVQLVAGVSADHALWRPPGAANSTFDLVFHMDFWTRWALEVLAGRTGPEAGDRMPDFPRLAGVSSDSRRWHQLAGRFQEALGLLERACQQLSEEDLARPERGADLLLEAAGHNLWHGGQVMLLRRMWERSRT